MNMVSKIKFMIHVLFFTRYNVGLRGILMTIRNTDFKLFFLDFNSKNPYTLLGGYLGVGHALLSLVVMGVASLSLYFSIWGYVLVIASYLYMNYHWFKRETFNFTESFIRPRGNDIAHRVLTKTADSMLDFWVAFIASTALLTYLLTLLPLF